jgi:hypothetical protein
VPISGFFEAPELRRIDDDRCRDRAPIAAGRADFIRSADLIGSPVNTPAFGQPRIAGRNTADTDLPPIVHLR